MRLSDLLLLLCAAGVVITLPRLGTRYRATATLVLGSVAAMQWLDGLRWQLLPALLVVLLGLILVLARVVSADSPPQRPARHPAMRRGVVATGLLAVLASAGLAAALPITGLPSPGGPYPVGTLTYTVTDTERMDPYAPAEQRRRFPVQVWYPALEKSAPQPWISDQAAAPFSAQVTTWLGLPPFALRHLRLVETHAAEDVRPVPGPLPVVVYSHGWGGFRSIQSDLAEELASRGYMVVAPDHVYGALATRYPDGTVVAIEPEALPEPEDVSEGEYARRSRLLERTYASDLLVSLETLADLGRYPLEIDDAARGVLEALEPDLGQIVMTGHSTGGGAATWACADIGDRCAGVVGFDPWLVPVAEDVLAAGSPVPYVALRSEEWLARPNDEVVRDYLDASTGPTWALSIPGAQHRDFTLIGFLSPLSRALGLAGEVPPDRMHDGIKAVTLALVEHVIHGEPTTLLDTAGHPVVQLR